MELGSDAHSCGSKSHQGQQKIMSKQTEVEMSLCNPCDASTVQIMH